MEREVVEVDVVAVQPERLADPAWGFGGVCLMPLTLHLVEAPQCTVV
jgi:hypothetical protein